jgi:hypothetical protein
MYTTLPEIWEGWTKNIFLGMRDQLGLLSFGAFVGLLGALALPAWLLSGLLWLLLEGSPVGCNRRYPGRAGLGSPDLLPHPGCGCL